MCNLRGIRVCWQGWGCNYPQKQFSLPWHVWVHFIALQNMFALFAPTWSLQVLFRNTICSIEKWYTCYEIPLFVCLNKFGVICKDFQCQSFDWAQISVVIHRNSEAIHTTPSSTFRVANLLIGYSDWIKSQTKLPSVWNFSGLWEKQQFYIVNKFFYWNLPSYRYSVSYCIVAVYSFFSIAFHMRLIV